MVVSERDIGPLYIGTSGWHFASWRGSFYPSALSEGQWLAYYQQRFPAVEINNSFYQMPSTDTLAQWRAAVGPDFRFAVKASRYLTHMKKLKDPAEPLQRFYRAVAPLEENLGPILLQLPPNWRPNTERLAAFLQQLSSDHQHVIECRDHRWHKDAVYALLREYDVSFCIYDLEGFTSPKVVTNDRVYIRLHGPEGKYQGRYSRQALAGWVGAIAQWRRQGKTVWLFFDNDDKACAPINAAELLAMVED